MSLLIIKYACEYIEKNDEIWKRVIYEVLRQIEITEELIKSSNNIVLTPDLLNVEAEGEENELEILNEHWKHWQNKGGLVFFDDHEDELEDLFFKGFFNLLHCGDFLSERLFVFPQGWH